MAQVQPSYGVALHDEFTTVYQGDCLFFMKESVIPPASVDLIVTSPPYNVGRDYAVHDDEMSPFAYEALISEFLRLAWRVLKPGGRIAINIGAWLPSFETGGEVFLARKLEAAEFKHRTTIFWLKGDTPEETLSASSSTAWGSWRSASAPAIRSLIEPVVIASKGDWARKSENDPGLGPKEFVELTKNIWLIPPERDLKAVHPCPFPVELPRRLIRLLSFPGDTILDPFAGTGQTLKAARLVGDRRAVGVELDPAMLAVIRANALVGTPRLDSYPPK